MKIKMEIYEDKELDGKPWRIEIICDYGAEYPIGVSYIMSKEAILRGFDPTFDHAVSSLKLAFHRKITQDIENKQKEKPA